MTGDRLRVYITVDTETSMGGAWRHRDYAPLPLDRPVFGNYHSRQYGIPLIMDILETYGFRATFFTEVFCSYIVGREEVASVFRHIRERGHDPQLHLHPTYRFYRDFLAGQPRQETDLMFQLPEDEQRRLIGEGIERFEQFTGQRPRAYRAGCYGASETTLKVLREHGVEIDSSYNLAYLGTSCGFQTESLNAPLTIEGVHEFPVTCFRVSGLAGYKPLEISAVSVAEILATIQLLREAGCLDVVLSLHSFSLLKNRGLRFEHCRPDHIVIRRLHRLCAALAERKSEIEVGVLGELALPSTLQPQPQVIPALGWLRPSLRKFLQGVNRLPF
jgi:hypothetical protein